MLVDELRHGAGSGDLTLHDCLYLARKLAPPGSHNMVIASGLSS